MVSAAIGIGCRRRVAASAIIGLVREALARLASPPDRVRLFTIERKGDEAGLIEAATTLGYDLIALPEAQFAGTSADLLARGVRPSARVRTLSGSTASPRRRPCSAPGLARRSSGPAWPPTASPARSRSTGAAGMGHDVS